MSCHEGKGRRHRRFKWEFWKKGRIPPVTDADVFDSTKAVTGLTAPDSRI